MGNFLTVMLVSVIAFPFFLPLSQWKVRIFPWAKCERFWHENPICEQKKRLCHQHRWQYENNARLRGSLSEKKNERKIETISKMEAHFLLLTKYYWDKK